MERAELFSSDTLVIDLLLSVNWALRIQTLVTSILLQSIMLFFSSHYKPTADRLRSELELLLVRGLSSAALPGSTGSPYSSHAAKHEA